MTTASPRLAAPVAGRLAAVPGVFREIGDLKRVRVAHADGSVAQRAFVRSWADLVGGADPGAEGREQLATGAEDHGVVGVDGLALVELVARDVQLEHAGVGVQADQVAVADPRQRAADRRLGRNGDASERP